MTPEHPSTPEQHPSTVDAFDFMALDDLGPDQRWTTWWDVEPLCRGPEPRPDWVVTSRGAVDTELGILKTGKEGDVFLLERADPHTGAGVVLAAKRYRSPEHRTFHRSATYVEGRRVRRSRDARALARKSAYGREVAAGQWAWAEWQALVRLWSAGLPVPYPVQIDGTELLMEWIGHDGETAPRLAQTRPSARQSIARFDQLREAMALMVEQGLVHGDLSAYNILVEGERLVLIDLPQVTVLVANPHGFDLLLRDCRNVCAWFTARGHEVDPDELFADLMAHAF